jgi:Fur family ferric uptake transcriptional regulator
MTTECQHESFPSAQFTPDGILAHLSSEGLRLTGGRKAIIRVLFTAGRPLTIEEVRERAGTFAVRKPDYATVFRLLQELEERNIVAKVNLQKSCSYFELRDPRKHYDHLVCRDCGKVILLEMPCPVRETENLISARYGFRDLSHSLEFFGQCPACSNENARSSLKGI